MRQVEGLRGETAAIKSANDPPRTLEELQARAQLGDARIDSPENKVRIPVVKHIDINQYYSTPNAQFGGLSPRDYLRGKIWDEQMQVGLNVLKRFGVLQ